MDEDSETTDAVICGCGPTGALLSGYLSKMSVKHIVLEKESGITTDPRGIALDEDGIRLLQGVGIYEPVYHEIGTCMQLFKFIGGTRRDLHREAFLEMDYATTEGGTGHVGFICHRQPILEQHLRATMTKSSNEFCQLRSGCTIMEIRQDAEWTYCRYRDEHGELHALRSRFFVGADGKTGFTRKNYLEPLGIHMERADGAFYDETWVALNWQIDLPTEKTHPNFPLWSKGYTPQQVYDLFFPVNFRFLCNPQRPAVCGRFGLPEDRLWRFEFVVRSGEDGDEMATSEKTQQIILPYLTHAGKRYGLSQDVRFPEDCIRVLRSRPFRFAGRVCNRWSHGRVILCGDAAHVFPPFGGQGIASGFRDAASLAWRLALLCRREPLLASTQQQPQDAKKKSQNHESVLEAWYLERKQQLNASLASTIENGRFVTEANPLHVLFRTLYLFCMNLHQQHQQLAMPFIPGLNGGLCLPQVYCKPVGAVQQDQKVEGRGSIKVFFTDDVIFSAWKQGLFQLLVYLDDLSGLEAAREMVASVEKSVAQEEEEEEEEGANSDGQGICLSEATYLVEDVKDKNGPSPSSVYQLASAEEFAASPLCAGRPAPQGYDPHYISKALGGTGPYYVIIRPDRFIFAACRKREELERAISAVLGYVRG
ncbi:hypothetical protein BJY01DRAFT_251424 [Aspergillus pseudoustus]|uniref:FAD-binding domain-containing protein n=1 Tax=Aspergillus pseudoustus TaxID=1810923 RepID=A0ABR4JD00_9EURO